MVKIKKYVEEEWKQGKIIVLKNYKHYGKEAVKTRYIPLGFGINLFG
jgi:hypothetical protein